LAAPVEVGIIERAAARARRRSGHETFFDAEGFVEHEGDGGEAVRGAARVRHDRVAGRELVVVDAVDDREIHAVGRGRDQHFAGTRFDVLGGLFALREDARAFHHDVDAEFLPRQLGRVPLGRDLDAPLAHIHPIVAGRDRVRIEAVHGIVLEQMGVGLHGAEIVDADDLQILAARFRDRAQHEAADATETVDCDFDSHVDCLLQCKAGAEPKLVASSVESCGSAKSAMAMLAPTPHKVAASSPVVSPTVSTPAATPRQFRRANLRRRALAMRPRRAVRAPSYRAADRACRAPTRRR